MYEHRGKPFLPARQFYKRLYYHPLAAFIIVFISPGAGVSGYHYFEGPGLVDSLLNASMIPGGMGPVDQVKTAGGKLFASFYALFSGIIFLVIDGVILAPVFQRFLHKLHIEFEYEKKKAKGKSCS